MPKRVGKYELGKTLGEGTFGKVKYAVNTDTGARVAVKILDKEKIQKQNMGAQIKKEISIMKLVKHRHVVSLHEVLASRTKIFIVLELVVGGELFDKIVAEGRFNEQQARFYFGQLMDGVAYCHDQGVAHRDLKPENLLLDEYANLKISDFGLSALYTGADGDTSRATLLHTTCGTPNYVAPEVLNDKGYDGRAADVWSCGVILYVLLAGFLPFDEPNMSALFKKIQRADFVYPSWFSREMRDLIDRILVADPAKRIRVSGIMQHPWMQAAAPPGPAPFASGAAAAAAAGGGGGGGGAGVKHVPSAKQMEEAVDNVAEDGDAAGGDDDTQQAVNSFEVVNMFGGLALNRLLAVGAARRRSAPQFITRSPVPALLARVNQVFEELGASEATVHEQGAFVDGEIVTPKGAVSVRVQAFRMSDSLHMVQVMRGKGDILAYDQVQQSVWSGLSSIMQVA